jgi:hypothetical protein
MGHPDIDDALRRLDQVTQAARALDPARRVHHEMTHGANVVISTQVADNSPLHSASISRWVDIGQQLIACGAGVIVFFTSRGGWAILQKKSLKT